MPEQPDKPKLRLYDPPSGWRYGFPKVYAPLSGEPLQDTLIRDGYPAEEADFASKHCRFISVSEEVKGD